MRVLFIVPYPTEGPSVRYRIEQYLPYLHAQGVTTHVSRFASPALYRLLLQPGYIAQKAFYSVSGVWRRVRDCARVGRYDLVVVHLEACPIGPPLFERLWAERKPLLFDLDDAIYMRNRYGANRALHFLKDTNKVPTIIRLSARVTVCNDHLRAYAARFTAADRIDMIPTSVDTTCFVPRPNGRPHPVPVLGWIGSYTTSPYLQLVAPALQRLARQTRFVLRVIGAGRPIRSLRAGRWLIDDAGFAQGSRETAERWRVRKIALPPSRDRLAETADAMRHPQGAVSASRPTHPSWRPKTRCAPPR